MNDPPRPHLRVLDLFSGLGGWSAAFRERGHEVVTVDLDPRFRPTLARNVLELRPEEVPGPWDLILASPPCECFSVMTIGRNWPRFGPPSPRALAAVRVVERTLELVRVLAPRAWIMENPRGMLRTLPVVAGLERRTVTYCQYGVPQMKPTDLWGSFPPTLRLHAPCRAGDPCHERNHRGARQGTRALPNPAARALIPHGLSLAVCLALENWTAPPLLNGPRQEASA